MNEKERQESARQAARSLCELWWNERKIGYNFKAEDERALARAFLGFKQLSLIDEAQEVVKAEFCNAAERVKKRLESAMGTAPQSFPAEPVKQVDLTALQLDGVTKEMHQVAYCWQRIIEQLPEDISFQAINRRVFDHYFKEMQELIDDWKVRYSHLPF